MKPVAVTRQRETSIEELTLVREENSLPSDFELLALSREGDRSAFATLWERHRLAGITAARSIAPSLDPDDLVSGAYLRILELMDAGKGPTGAFRPYLYRVITTMSADEFRIPEASSQHLDEIPDLTEAGPWEDSAFDLNAAARAFETLPERWRAALWYSEVEGLAPRQIAPLLGLSANGVSALVVRAREGLQSAWVEAHIDMQLAEEACRSTREHLQRFQLGKLTARRTREVAAHLDTCADCAAAAAEFRTLNKQLALVLSMILVGGASGTALLKQFGVAAASGTAAAGTSALQPSAAMAGGGSASGVGTAVVSVAAGVALVAAAIGGVVLANPFLQVPDQTSAAEANEGAAEVKPTEQTDPTSSSELQSDGSEDSSSGSTTDESAEPSSPRPERGGGQTGSTEAPTTPKPPVPPVVVPPVAPAEITAGTECYVPSIAQDRFSLTGKGSVAGTIEVGVSTSSSIQVFQTQTAQDGSWTSAEIDSLGDFLLGEINVQIRLVSNTQSSIWETADPLAICL